MGSHTLARKILGRTLMGYGKVKSYVFLIKLSGKPSRFPQISMDYVGV